MALVVMCGLPASGKTSVAERLRSFLQVDGHSVRIVQDGADILPQQHSDPSPPPPSRFDLYLDSSTEKQTRSQLRAAVERALSESDTTVIVDSLNYIKGFRYELYCVAKTAAAAYSVVYTHTPLVECAARDAVRAATGDDAYGGEILAAIARRFEAPIGRNRWDSPLYTVDMSDPAVWPALVEDVAVSLQNGRHRSLRATMATRPVATPGADALADLDRVTRAAEAALVARLQAGAAVGDTVKVPGSNVSVRFQRKPRVAELRDMRRAYINYSRMNPTPSNRATSPVDEYVHYINEQLRTRR